MTLNWEGNYDVICERLVIFEAQNDVQSYPYLQLTVIDDMRTGTYFLCMDMCLLWYSPH